MTKLFQLVLLIANIFLSVSIPGGYTPVACNDAGVQKAVKYAVDFYFKSSPPPAPVVPTPLKNGKAKKAGKAGKGGPKISFVVYFAEVQVMPHV